MKENLTLGDFDVDCINERISKLKGGLSVIHPGGSSQVEVNECRDRITDALCATRVALQCGYVAGGGTALLHASHNLKFEGN